jgi:hypothetical protein
MNLTRAIRAAKAPSPWRVGNQVLYDLCRSRPAHNRHEDILAKIWLIGRSYAAAIERRSNKTVGNDDFYIRTVAPKIATSDIDQWITAAKRCKRWSDDSWNTLLDVHLETTQLFNKISGLNKRSLASKYLHFHVPDMFYIYDSRAVKAIQILKSIVGRARRSDTAADGEYRKFAEKCCLLHQHLIERYGTDLTPREIDNLLLYLHGRG